MIKVIAGNFKGRLLSKMSVRDIRPTQARVRKSIFQILEPLEGKSVLDLFAGTGILGIESISRGARNVIAIERNKEACQMIRKSIKLLCAEDYYNVICMDAMKYLKQSNDKFDIILCDPPYVGYNYLDIFSFAKKMVKKNGYFCMEMRIKTIDDPLFRIKKFGSTQVIIWRNDE